MSKVILTYSRSGNKSCIKLTRAAEVDKTQVFHEAGGHLTGLVVNKKAEYRDEAKPDSVFKFRFTLKDLNNGYEAIEERHVKFFFDEPSSPDSARLRITFIELLISEVPKPYENLQFFIRGMKLMKSGEFQGIKAVTLEYEPMKVPAQENQIQVNSTLFSYFNSKPILFKTNSVSRLK